MIWSIPNPLHHHSSGSRPTRTTAHHLFRNAADSASQLHGTVRIEWSYNASYLDLLILDEGPGISNTANLFVPFFTTKPGGSGIGLVLSRQIAEAHGGSLTLQNRTDRRRQSPSSAPSLDPQRASRASVFLHDAAHSSHEERRQDPAQQHLEPLKSE